MSSKALPPLESKVVTGILTYLRSRGCFASKIHGDALQPSLLDIIACYKGRFIHVEVKRAPGIPPTPRQEYTIGQVRDAGGWSGCISSVAEMVDILQQIDKETSRADTSS